MLSVILQDTAASSAPSVASAASLRLAYSMSLIRFVNGLVDPAQTGPFARSIASIATQIGLPLWFVELRHAATHEDLPGLQVLRDAGRKAMDWLYERYWLPQLQFMAGGAGENEEREQVTPEARDRLVQLLAQYKAHRKQALRDVSKSHEKEHSRLVRQIERWVVDNSTTSEAGFRRTSDAQGASHAAACAGLAETLCQVGNLVPTSRK